MSHYIKYRNFSKFAVVEILRKGAVSAEFRVIHTKLCGNCDFPQNLHTRKLGKMAVFYAMSEYGFSMTLIFLSRDKIYDSVLIRENIGQKNPYPDLLYTMLFSSILVMGDCNADVKETNTKVFCNQHNFKALIEEPNCFKI